MRARCAPSGVAVHRVVAAADGGDAIGGQLGEILDRGVRRDVPSVGERVNPRLLGREAKQCAQVVDVRVDAPVRDEPQQMDALAALEGRTESLVLEERAVLDRLR